MSDPDQIAVDDLMSVLNRGNDDYQSNYSRATERQGKVAICKEATQNAYELVNVLKDAFRKANTEDSVDIPKKKTPFAANDHDAWFKQFENFISKMSSASLSEDEEISLKRGLSDIANMIKFRNDDAHRLSEVESTFQAIKKFPDSIQIILAIFNTRRLSQRFVDLVFDHWNKEPAARISWVRFWRTLGATPLEPWRETELLNRLRKVQQIKSDFSMNRPDHLSDIIQLQRNRFPTQEIESVLYEIKAEIETCAPAAILELFQQPVFQTVFKFAENNAQKVLRVIRLKISESGQGEGSQRSLLVDIERAERGKKPEPFPGAEGKKCESLNEVIELLTETLTADSETIYDKWALQLLVPPKLGHEVCQQENLQDFHQDLSVVVGAPRKGSMNKKNYARLDRKEHHQVSRPDAVNQFKDEVPGTKEIKRKSSARVGQVQLFAGQTAWAAESECVWMDSFAELPFSMFVLCVNEDPQEDWNEVLGIDDSSVDVFEFMDRLGQKQLENDEGENHVPLVLWQDTQYEPMRAKGV